MITVSETTRKKNTDFADRIDKFSSLTEEFNIAFNEGKTTEAEEKNLSAEILKLKAASIRQGDFKIIVCGRFKNGKSTFVNALLEKEIMAAKATACTAVIAVVKKGTDENYVEVFYNDGTSQKLSLKDFTEEFQLTEDEQAKIDSAAENGDDIVFDRFTDVDHVEMQSMHPMFQSGCSLIDTPGFEEALSRDKTTNTYLPSADAVIMMLNATALFSKNEKEFISKNFVGKYKENVFFIINRVNQLQEGQLENQVIPAVRSGLKNVFTDEHGVFNEELFNRRVFYVNAHGALCAATGKPERMFLSGRWMEFPVDINTTGVPECEESIVQYINSESRNNGVLSSALDLLANKYREAENNATAKIDSMAMSDAERKVAAQTADKELAKAKKAIEDIEKAFSRFSTLASDALFINLMDYMDRTVKGEFPAYIEREINAQHYKASWAIADGLLSALAILPVEIIREKVEEICERHGQPLADIISEYVQNKLRLWQTQCGACIEKYSDDLTAEMEELVGTFETSISASVHAFTGVDVGRKTSTKGNVQMALAAIIGNDMSAIVDINNGENGQGIGWGALAGKYVAQGLIDSILYTINPGALILRFGIDALIVAMRAKQNAQKKALAMGNGAITKYKEAIKADELKFKKGISDQINETKDKVSQVIVSDLNKAKANVDTLAASHKKSDDEEACIRNEMGRIIGEMRSIINTSYEVVYGRKPSQSEFENLGAH